MNDSQTDKYVMRKRKEIEEFLMKTLDEMKTETGRKTLEFDGIDPDGRVSFTW